MGDDATPNQVVIGFEAGGFSNLEESVVLVLDLRRDAKTVDIARARLTPSHALQIAAAIESWVRRPIDE
jgi:hypothetical protein